ncbi:MAG: SIS domain-containing protein [Candidatus Lokiarchaeota archaeon]|nr:SIS domain-containing protein [Candidatus Lokiarchaeota archaeon]
MKKEQIVERFKNTLSEIEGKINLNSKSLNSNIVIQIIKEILQIYNNNAMIFIYGAGRSGFIGRCFAQRLMHLGIKSCFISDAVTHRYTERDLLILISGSGETTSPRAIANKAKEIGGKIILFTGNQISSIAKISDLVIKIEGKSKEKAIYEKTLAPYTSLFDISTLAILDSIGGILMEELSVSEEIIDNHHASIE